MKIFLYFVIYLFYYIATESNSIVPLLIIVLFSVSISISKRADSKPRFAATKNYYLYKFII
jgi:hypothetical protein